MDKYHEMCATIASLIHQSVRCTGLEQQNQWQAARLMEYEQRFRILSNVHKIIADSWKRVFAEQEAKMKQEENKISENVIDLEERKKLLMAGKEPPGGGNWLSKLPKGTRFLASRKSLNDSSLGDYFIGSDPTKMPAVFLGFELNHRDGGFRFVDPVKFSKDYEFFMTIEAEFRDDGTDVQTGGVEGDGQS